MFKVLSSGRLATFAALTFAIALPTAVNAVPFTIENLEPFGFDCASIPAAQDAQLSCVGPTPDHIEWVDGTNPVSSLDVFDLGPLNGINPGGPAVRLTRIEHDNVVIPVSFSYNIDVIGTVRVTDEATTLSELESDGRIPIEFTETVNGAPCPPPNPENSICDDFFDFDPTTLLPLPFDVGGISYVLIFGLEPGVGTTVIGNRVFTAETTTSELFLTVRIEEVDRPMPEPVTMALLGLGLIGLGFTVRTRKLY
jgi:PEP-CTERM motif